MRLAILICLLCLGIISLSAQEPVKFDIKFDYPPVKQQRTLLAKSLLKYFEDIDAQIPNLKPAETEWLSEEEKRIRRISSVLERSQQRRSLRQSREYTVWLVKQDLVELTGKFRALVTESYLDESRTNRIAGQKDNVLRWRREYTLKDELTEWLSVQEWVLLSGLFARIEESRSRGISMPYLGLEINGHSSLEDSPQIVIAAAINSEVVSRGIRTMREPTSAEGISSEPVTK